jgi:hypothetical protein
LAVCLPLICVRPDAGRFMPAMMSMCGPNAQCGFTG